MTPCHCNTHKPRRYGRDTWIAVILALIVFALVYEIEVELEKNLAESEKGALVKMGLSVTGQPLKAQEVCE